jgi:hypothetical protein
VIPIRQLTFDSLKVAWDSFDLLFPRSTRVLWIPLPSLLASLHPMIYFFVLMTLSSRCGQRSSDDTTGFLP